MRPSFAAAQIAVWGGVFALLLAAALLWWPVPMALVDRGLIALLGLLLTSAWRPWLRRARHPVAIAGALLGGGGALGLLLHGLHQTLVAATFDTWSVVGLWRHGVPKMLATAPMPVAAMLAWGAGYLAVRSLRSAPSGRDAEDGEPSGARTNGALGVNTTTGMSGAHEAAPVAYAERLVVRDAARVIPVAVDTLRWVEAEGDYVRLHTTDGRSVLHRQTMAAIEQRLDPAVFVRIHRSAIVRTAAVREVRRLSRGEAEAVLDDGTVQRIGRAYRPVFDARVTA